MGLRVWGAHHVPREGPVILAANHQSYFDPPLLGVATRRRLAFLAKQELFRHPWFAKLIQSLGAFPINRDGPDIRAMKDTLGLLREGKAVILFPEGTRGRGGHLLPPRAGVGFVAYASGAPVVPVRISGTEKIWHTFLGLNRVRIWFGQPVQAPPEVSGAAERKHIYHEFSHQIMRTIAALGASKASQRAKDAREASRVTLPVPSPKGEMSHA